MEPVLNVVAEIEASTDPAFVPLKTNDAELNQIPKLPEYPKGNQAPGLVGLLGGTVITEKELKKYESEVKRREKAFNEHSVKFNEWSERIEKAVSLGIEALEELFPPKKMR